MQTSIYNHGVLRSCKSWKGLLIDLLTLGDPVDGDGVGDLHRGVEGGGDQPQEEWDYHYKAEDYQLIDKMQFGDFKVNFINFRINLIDSLQIL